MERRRHKSEGHRLQPEKVITSHRDDICSQEGAYTIHAGFETRFHKPKGLLQLQWKIALTSNGGESCDSRGTYIGKKNAVTSQRGAITGQRECLHRRYSSFTRWIVAMASQTGASNHA